MRGYVRKRGGGLREYVRKRDRELREYVRKRLYLVFPLELHPH